jgi:preprotein translocase subunit SecF
METNIIIVIGIFSIIVIVALILFRQKVKAGVEGPLGTKVTIDASNESASPLGVNVEDARSRQGGLRAEDKTGYGASVKRVEVQSDIIVSSSSSENPSPKS